MPTPLSMPPTLTAASSYEDPREHKASDLEEFLKKIAAIESSSGQNINHPLMTSGVHSGTSAVGDYGLMPLTARDIDRQTGNNQLADITDKADLQNKLEQNPELVDLLAHTMASNLLAKNPQDAAAYKWNQGQYTKPTDEDLTVSPYVQKFRALNYVK